ncbi:MAG: low molecular weight phosphotyrosine protein phosphatase [Halothiobacillaceae bacterium]|nr:low molecular weight phosphotyrosine protein phosphatase [Halothiobacillaceae bacterium]
MENSETVGILFVCMGNICRSPTAEGVFTHRAREAGLVDRLRIDSAGTHAYHIGNPPDPRSQEAALQRGIDLSCLRARKVEPVDIERFEYVLAMDADNFDILQRLSPPSLRERVRLFMDFAPDYGLKEVPDPYYGGPAGFERVLDMIEAASEGLITHLRRHHRL